jgi:hypothetical protein
MDVMKWSEWLVTNNITKCKLRNMAERMKCHIVSISVQYFVQGCALLCLMVCNNASNGVHYCVKWCELLCQMVCTIVPMV